MKVRLSETATYDVLVVGAGPAGLAAATEAARLGASVLLVDENDRPGGQLYKQIHRFFGSEAHYAGTRGFQIAAALSREAEVAGVAFRADTRAVGISDDGTVQLVCKMKSEAVRAKKIVLACGAGENALAFPGCTLPGVMTAGAAQTMSNVHQVLVGSRFLVVGSGNVGLIVSYQLMQAGADAITLIDAADHVTGYHVHAQKLKRVGVPIRLSTTVKKAEGNDRLERVELVAVDEHFRPLPGSGETIEVDTLLLAVGLHPRTDLAAMFRLETTNEPGLGGTLPLHDGFMRTSQPDIYVAGDLAGVEEASTALDEGRLAGIHAAGTLGFSENGATGRAILELQERLTDLRSGRHSEKRRSIKARIIEKGNRLYDRR